MRKETTRASGEPRQDRGLRSRNDSIEPGTGRAPTDRGWRPSGVARAGIAGLTGTSPGGRRIVTDIERKRMERHTGPKHSWGRVCASGNGCEPAADTPERAVGWKAPIGERPGSMPVRQAENEGRAGRKPGRTEQGIWTNRLKGAS